ncbi:heat shock cognate 70 kDa protein-like protein [Tanacetum coccineum]
MLDRHRHRRHSLSISKSGQWYFDISLLTMSMVAGIISCKVKAVSGTRLGCEDFVKAMIDHCVQEFKKRQKKDETSTVLGGVESGGVEVASS